MTEITAHRIALRRTTLLSGCLATALAAGAMPGLAAAGHASHRAKKSDSRVCNPTGSSPDIHGLPEHGSASWHHPLGAAVVRLTLAMHDKPTTPAKPTKCGKPGKPTDPGKPGKPTDPGRSGKPAQDTSGTPTASATGSDTPTTSTASSDTKSAPAQPTPDASTGANQPSKDSTTSGDEQKPSKDNGNGSAQSPSTDNSNASAPSAAPLPAATTPRAGRTLTLSAARGSVLIRLRGSAVSVPLSQAATVPMGSTIDARHGTVTLTDVRRGAKLQTATFWGGVFSVAQHRRSHDVTEVRLAGRVSCRSTTGRLHATTASYHRHHVRSLWAHDSHGRFSTRGRNAVATVRGTTWLTQDTCAGTRVKVRHGVVAVRDLHRHRTVIVRAGHSYLARRRHAGAQA